MKTHLKMIRGIAGSIFVLLLMAAISCAPPAEEMKEPIEGAWQLIHMKFVADGEVTMEVPGMATGSQVKMWTGSHFAFVGHFKMDTLTQDNYGNGTYTLSGTHYMETVKSQNGVMTDTTLMMFLEIRNDTLIQTWPADHMGSFDADNVSVETYIRLD